MIVGMAQVRMTEAEVAKDFAAVLERVRQGVEVVVEQDARPVAVIRTPPGPGRHIDECIALAKAYEERLGYAPVPDPGFAQDVQAAIDAHREPLDPPKWD
jgi:antitoxin (DNA-binding transcriptional repressor) of toxin-antitoxin stability system